MATDRRPRWEDWGPSIVVGGLAVTVFAVWAAKGAGYARTTWYPGGLFLLGLLAVVIAVAPQLGARLGRPAAIAAAFLFAYALWSYASIVWSSARADAWTGANRSLL